VKNSNESTEKVVVVDANCGITISVAGSLEIDC
jgi:hypothetical protein